MKSNAELPDYFVVGGDKILGEGDSPEAAISDAESYIDDDLDVKRYASDLSIVDDTRVARKGNALDEADLADGNWHTVSDTSNDGVGFTIEAIE